MTAPAPCPNGCGRYHLLPEFKSIQWGRVTCRMVCQGCYYRVAGYQMGGFAQPRRLPGDMAKRAKVLADLHDQAAALWNQMVEGKG